MRKSTKESVIVTGTLYLFERWDESQWVIKWRLTYAYDSNGNKTLHLSERWDESQWANYWRDTFTYDSNGNMVTDTVIVTVIPVISAFFN